MTKEQIAALIAAKITGQGSMVDIGGALPEILTALAENGISTDMTVAEQMQARKDLGLYYEETTTGEKTVQYTDEPESATLSGYAKISDDTPEKTDIVSFTTQSGDGLGFQDRADGYELYPIGAPSGVQIAVILDDSAGNEPGIYFNLLGAEYASLAVLVYNGPVTVVSKVPAKYVPVAWNQLVTEGTKIAEVTIGEETTEVFAPEGGGAVYAEVTTVPYPGMSLSDFTAAGFTEAVMRGFANHTIAGFVLNDGMGGTSVYPLSHAGMSYIDGYPLYEFSFTFLNNRRKVSAQPGMNYISITEVSQGPLEITGLPTAEMTTPADLMVIGLSPSAIKSASSGERTGIKYRNYPNVYFIPIISAAYESDLYKISFAFGNNRYDCIVETTDDTASVTITPLS